MGDRASTQHINIYIHKLNIFKHFAYSNSRSSGCVCVVVVGEREVQATVELGSVLITVNAHMCLLSPCNKEVHAIMT